jgi:hypothetical protein
MRAAADGAGVGDGSGDVAGLVGDDGELGRDDGGATTGVERAGVGVVVLPHAAASRAAITMAAPIAVGCDPSIRCRAMTASVLARGDQRAGTRMRER